jgi:hypothetical protein
MSFTTVQIRFLQRLVAERPPWRQAEASRFFCAHYSLGLPIRNRVEYREPDYDMARALLVNNHLPVEALGSEASRIDSAVFGGMSEKSFSAAPNARSIAVKPVGGCELDGHRLYAPEGGYIVLTPEHALRVRCDRLMLVENLETFRRLEAYSWINWGGHAVLAIYRGDLELPNKNAAQLVQARSEPIWAFVDFDPAGLCMVNSLPANRLESVVLPPEAWLEKASDTARGRYLFDSQVDVYSNVLDAAAHPQVVESWQTMKRLRSAVTQERMFQAEPREAS